MSYRPTKPHSCKISGYDFHFDRQVSGDTTIEQVFDGFPHGDLYPTFPTQLDRDLYEHTPHGAEAPMGSHEVTTGCSRHMKPEIIAQRAHCSYHEAVQLADALSVLDADPRLSREVCHWAYIKGVEPTLKYLHPFLVGVAQAEMSTSDPQSDEEPVIGEQEIRNLDELTVTELRRECERREVTAPTRLRRWQLISLLDRQDQHDAEPEESAPETLGYHTLAETDETDWIESQPDWFQALITSIQEAETSDALSAIGKSIYSLKLGSNQASVAWTFYNIRKTWLDRKTIVRQVAKTMAERITTAEPARLGGIGQILFGIQQGTTKGPKLNKKEWSVVWGAYKQARQAA